MQGEAGVRLEASQAAVKLPSCAGKGAELSGEDRVQCSFSSTGLKK